MQTQRHNLALDKQFTGRSYLLVFHIQRWHLGPGIPVCLGQSGVHLSPGIISNRASFRSPNCPGLEINYKVTLLRIHIQKE